jgi:hypothetical protein
MVRGQERHERDMDRAVGGKFFLLGISLLPEGTKISGFVKYMNSQCFTVKLIQT